MKVSVLIIIGLFLISACKDGIDHRNVHSAYKPILMENSQINTCVWEAAKPSSQITVSRKIGQYILALDYGLGIHVIDLQNINQPQKIGFYRIPACIDFEVKNQMIYANNYRDFIIVDFSNISAPNIIKRNPNSFLIDIKTPDGLEVFENFKRLPSETTIVSYEKIKP